MKTRSNSCSCDGDATQPWQPVLLNADQQREIPIEMTEVRSWWNLIGSDLRRMSSLGEALAGFDVSHLVS